MIPGLGRSAGEGIGYPLLCSWASLVAQLVKNLPAMWETWVGRPQFTAWVGNIPGEWKGFPLQYSGLENSMDCIVPGSQRVGHDRTNSGKMHTYSEFRNSYFLLYDLKGVNRDYFAHAFCFFSYWHPFNSQQLHACCLFPLIKIVLTFNPFKKSPFIRDLLRLLHSDSSILIFMLP